MGVVLTLSLTVLGCCGSYPYPAGGSACSGYLVSDGTTSIWLDAGTGTFANLQRHLAIDAVDAVVLTHEHPDHWTDLEGFHVATRYFLDRRGIPVYAPRGIQARAYNFPEPALVWHDIADGDRVEIGSLSCTFSRTDHGPETLAVRVDGDGSSLGYSADSGPAWSLEALGPGLQLALCEASFLEDQEGIVQHMSARQAGESARAAGAARLLLTHFWPAIDRERSRAEGAEAFGRDVELAVVNERYDV